MYAADSVLTGSLSLKDLAHAKISAYADSDLGGDIWTTKSTTGYWIELTCLNGRTFPLAWAARFQGSTSTHTCESETVALCDALKREIIPLQSLLKVLLKREVEAEVFEDNSACMTSVHKGYSPSMRYIGRTQRVSLGFLHDTCDVESQKAGSDSARRLSTDPLYSGAKPVALKKVGTDTQKADLFTKDLDKVRFNQLAELIGMRRQKTNKMQMIASMKALVQQSRSSNVFFDKSIVMLDDMD